MTETPHDDNAVPDFSGEAHQTLDISPPHPKPRVINRKIIWGASLISGLLAIGVVYSSISKQRSIAENSKADEAAPNISQTATGPGSAVNLPGSYTEFRAYQKRKDAAEAARRAAAAISPAPHLPKSLQTVTTGPASNKLPPSNEASYDENDPRLMAARQAALQRLNARTAAKASATLIRLQNPDRGQASNLKRLAGQTSPHALTMPEFPQIPGAVEDLLQANDQKAKSAYLNRKSDEPIYLNHALVKPASPYQVMAGNIIPSSLITGLNSDLPGFLIAQVRHNVYDSITGRHLLIPQGTRILGEYSSSVTYGQNRALVVWNRLIYPNGRSILLDGMPGVDLSGASGFKDKVDRHFWQLMGSAILGSLVATGADAAKGDDPNSILNNALSGTATTADQTIQQIIKKQLNVQPTIEIRPGYRFNIVVLADMILAPYDPQPATATQAR